MATVDYYIRMKCELVEIMLHYYIDVLHHTVKPCQKLDIVEQSTKSV